MKTTSTTPLPVIRSLYGLIYQKETSIVTIAQTIGVDRNLLYAIFEEEKPMPRRLFRKVCYVLGVTEDEVILSAEVKQLG